MELASVSLTFNITYDRSDLFVAMEVWNTTTSVPVLVTLVPMLNLSGNTYTGNFTADSVGSYGINKSVYTDDTFTIRDDNYPQGSDSFNAVIFPSSSAIELAVSSQPAVQLSVDC